VRGAAVITVNVTPTNNAYSAATSSALKVLVGTRTGTR
jgi:hypothetical protein